MKKQIIPWLIAILIPNLHFAQTQNCGLDTPFPLPNDPNEYFYEIEVGGYLNNTLGVGGQSVCAIEIALLNNTPEELNLRLQSPNGEIVELFGTGFTPDLNNSNYKLGTNINVRFVNCPPLGVALPAPGFGDQWDNLAFFGQGPIAVRTITGDYYPAGGCLDMFNAGPVNGTWRLLIDNSAFSDFSGPNQAITDFKIIFCDEEGVLCCRANAGRLLPLINPIVCAGSDEALLSNLTVFYTNGRGPDPADYAYRYVVTQNGQLIRYEGNGTRVSTPDMRDDAPGEYEIYGISYRISEGEPNLADYNSMDDLRAALATGGAFCGEVTADPVQLTIIGVDEGQTQTVTCDRTAVNIGGLGTSQGNGITYQWTKLPGSGDGEIIANADQIQATVDGGGMFILNLLNAPVSCPSDTIMVNQDNIPPTVFIEDPEPIRICVAQSITLDGAQSDSGPNFNIDWDTPAPGVIASGANTLSPTIDWLGGAGLGDYTLNIVNINNGCDNSFTVTVEDIFLLIEPNIATQETVLNCVNQVITLDGTGSTTGPEIIYSWEYLDGFFPNGQQSTVGLTVDVDQPGTYRLNIFDAFTGCRNRQESITIIEDFTQPVAEAGNSNTLDCSVTEVTLDGTASNPTNELSFEWTGPMGSMIQDADTATPTVNMGGMYYLTVTHLVSQCTAIDSVEVIERNSVPTINAVQSQTFDCEAGMFQEILVDATPSDPANTLTYEWTGPGIIGGADAPLVRVNQPGTYGIRVIEAGDCSVTSIATVLNDFQLPIADAGQPSIIDCNNPIVTLGGLSTSVGSNFINNWFSNNGNLIGDRTQSTIQTDQQGVYGLIVTNVTNRCSDTSLVSIATDIQEPLSSGVPDQIIPCDNPSIQIDVRPISIGANINYTWSGPCAIVDPNTPGVISIDCPGIYTVEAENLDNGCSNFDQFEIALDPNTPLANIVENQIPIDCQSGTAIIDATTSFGGDSRWFLDDKEALTNVLNPVINEPGVYRLEISNNISGCVSVDSVIITDDCKPEIALISPTTTITCTQPTASIEVEVMPIGPTYEYVWTSNNNCFIGNTNQSLVNVSCGDTYQLIVNNPATQASDTIEVDVPENTNPPIAIANVSDVLTCTNSFVEVDANDSSFGANISYNWLDDSGASIGTNVSQTINQAGIYFLEVTDLDNGCTNTTAVEVNGNTIIPEVSFDSIFFPCFRDSFQVNTTIEPVGENYSFNWGGSGIIGANQDSFLVINGPGTYTLNVVNLNSGCTLDTTLNLLPSNCPPCIELLNTPSITCLNPVSNVTVGFCDDCTGCTINWTTTDGVIDAGGNTLNPTFSSPGEYLLTVTNPNGLSSIERVLIPDERNIPMLQLSDPSLITCSNPVSVINVEMADSGPEFELTWQVSGGQSFPSNVQSITTPEAGMLSATLRNTITGCEAVATVNVGMDTISPVSNVDISNRIDCINPSAILNASRSSFSNAGTFNWTSATGEEINGADAPNPIVSQGGTYTLALRDSVNGCETISNIVVIADLTPPDLLPIASTALTCGVSSVELVGNVPSPIGFEFEWCTTNQDGTVDNCNRTDLTLQADQPGNYIFRVTDNNNGCVAEQFIEVSDSTQLPIIDAGETQELNCATMEVTLDGTITNDGNFFIQWSNVGNFPITDSNTLRPIVNNAGTYLLEVTNSTTGCQRIDSVEVQLNETLPTFTVSTDTMIDCAISEIQLSVQAAPGNGDVNFIWSTTDGNIIGDFDESGLLVDAPGIYLVEVINPLNGCSNVDSIVVREGRVFPRAIIQNDLSELDCFNEVLLLDGGTSISATSLNYQWSYLDGSTGIVGPSVNSTVQVTEPGFYQLIVEDVNNNCQDTTFAEIFANQEVPSVVVEMVETITCTDPEVVLDASGSSTGDNYIVQWINEEREVVADSVVATAVESGFYTLLIGDVINGCEDSLSIFVPIDTTQPSVQVNAPQELNCLVNETEIEAIGNEQFAYNWSTNEGNIISSSSGRRILVDQPGAYVLEARNENNGCTSTNLAIVPIANDEIVNVSVATIPPNCTDTRDGQIVVSEVEGGEGPFLYSISNNIFGDNNTFSNLTSGTYVINVQNEDGCEYSMQVDLPPAEALSVELGPDLVVSIGEEVTLKPEVTGVIDQVEWSIDKLENQPNTLDVVVQPFENKLYRIRVANNAGCEAQDDIYIQVNKTKSVYIPNVIYPDSNDPANSRFTVYAKDNGTIDIINKLSIYNRWGLLVFTKENFLPNDPSLGWNGIYDGVLLNTGTFTYTVEVTFIDGLTELFQGDLLLLK